MAARQSSTTVRCRLLGHAWVYRAADDAEVCSRHGCVYMRRIGDWFPSPDPRRGSGGRLPKGP